MQSKNPLPFSFTGSGGEYFRIWIVNVFLTIITLGIYSAWAKVRRNQYFYRNTWLDEANFDYHGNPVAILKGRILAVALLVAYNFSGKISPLLFLAVAILIGIVMPYLLLKSFRFRAINTSYRGLRFGFSAPLKDAYKTFLLLPVLTVFTLYLLAPFTHQRIKKFQHDHSRFGITPFHFDAPVGKFYKIYGVVLLLYIVLIGALAAMLVPLFMASNNVDASKVAFVTTIVLVFFVLVALVIGPYFIARLQNLVWNHTTLGDQPRDLQAINPAYYEQTKGIHTFESAVKARALLWIFLTNFIGIIFTLGLFKPFADIRLARYRLSHVQLIADGNLEDFISHQQGNVDASGEEVAEIFDLDIAL
ncbi:MAG: hypothetical protein CTY33_09150 [Methylotenera sp.]|nr:MAG: hypothetical protein CTY33_09150 [Methylotenera sp.]